jgi:hypothetical protein
VYFELDSIGALVMLFPGRHGGFRIAVMGESDMMNELPTVSKRQPYSWKVCRLVGSSLKMAQN